MNKDSDSEGGLPRVPLPNTPDPQFAWRPDGRLVGANASGFKWLGRDGIPAEGARLQDLVKMEDDGLEGLLREALDQGVARGRVAFVDPAGTRRAAALHLGRSEGLIYGVAHAVSPESGLSEDAAQSIGRLLNHIAHELRDPLGAIQTSAEVLSKLLTLDEEEGALLTVIVKEVQRLKFLLNDFLLYVRPPRLVAREIRLGSSIRAALELVPHTDPKYREVRLHVAPEADGFVLVSDSDALTHILLNLLLNAYEAVGREGEITVLLESLSRDRVAIEVGDSGPGIPPADRERAWEPFFSTKRARPGLGLAAVRKTAEAMAGTAELRPDGRTIRVEIPRNLVVG
ncbi:MAG: hypothetical protein KC466_05865 [Myxococcales bacterium]|nr:hypothetical protein [Myxococcales bacterium]